MLAVSIALEAVKRILLDHRVAGYLKRYSVWTQLR